MEFSFNLLVSTQTWFRYAMLLMLASLTLCLTIKFPPKDRIEKPWTPKLPPGPQPWPLIGNLPEMVANKPVFRWIDKLMSDFNTDVLCLRLGSVHVVPVSCSRIACEFLKKQDANFASRPLSMAADLISGGYLNTTLVPFGEQWKKMKKLVRNELISPMRLQWLHDKRAQEADNLVRYVYGMCNNNTENKGGLVNLRVVSQQYCGNVIRKMIFNKRYFGEGGKDGGPGFEEEVHVDATFTLLRLLYAFCVSDFMPCLGVFDFDGHEKVLTKALETFKKYHDPIVDDRIQQWNDGRRRKEEMEDLLDVLISLKDAVDNLLLTPVEIKATIIDLMNATVDNPSNALEWAIAEMTNKPELLETATQELDSVVGKHRLVQESDLWKLNYVKACAREAFRLHPVAPFIPPHVCMAYTVVAHHFMIPKGSHVILSRTRLGRNPRVREEDADEFKPERHIRKTDSHDSDDDVGSMSLTEPDLRFISFSIGRRGCPGVTLGTSMTLMLFARLLQCFTWSVPRNVSRIDLSESKDDLSLAVPLVATAKPRLPVEVFPLRE
ncbi:isoleucine N-monooxygenase 2-like [Prosopis cineraria]|uniref:isoleucine N-monooxygenase 2-like n=1 Tax=Prosopis cineraria TaxID=364024 RepID=UPI00240F9E37|nr:isoleucine N-monooxygenase 2-like [Prosopis cineraria]